MGAKTDELVVVLTELHELTKNDHHVDWAQWMMNAKSRLEKSDFSGIDYLLGAYGGMGSFNDIYIHSSKELDERFSLLRTRAWELANHIKRNHEINT